ncbi:MAG: acyl--CoA ligase [Flavobacteriales bacterium]|nr:acyl--CoA ligase [Flavobacteriales bacterium]
MLRLELAVMASGGIAVPIFAFFHQETAELLIKHSDARFLAVAGELQLDRLDPDLPLDHVFCFDRVTRPERKNLVAFEELLAPPANGADVLDLDADPDALCLNMYTSGTMGTPKCVQLSHRNILSQQAALAMLWDLGPDDRFLSYLPWHHSFGGIFELFTALRTGATMYLESGYGKDPMEIGRRTGSWCGPRSSSACPRCTRAWWNSPGRIRRSSASSSTRGSSSFSQRQRPFRKSSARSSSAEASR